jgi:integrase
MQNRTSLGVNIMAISTGNNPNHPSKVRKIKVEPIRSKRTITRIKKILDDNPRNHCLFTLGINTGFRASDLLAITINDVKDLKQGDDLELKEIKTKKNRRVTLNGACVDSIQRLITTRKSDDIRLFIGQRGPLTVPTVNHLVKLWCRDEGLKGNYGSHTLRKTWGYQQRVAFKTPLPLLMEALNHSTQRQTLDYLCIQPEEIKSLYENTL